LELYLAIRNILETETVVTGDEVTNTQTERLNARIDALRKEINSRNPVGVMHGDNSNRGSQPPTNLGGS